ncbi:glycosyltransferase family 9 protein [Micavibrio aeruginosavorus]|uniref:glycosyltransferase family 9 protein n=1 Tax=Micavibrio aeruginosavorus TaxID=349221 RepID=UPI003F4A9469
MNILFITSNRLGDAVLSTGILDHLAKTHPDAKICVACGPIPASLFEGAPNVRCVIPFKKEKYNLHWFKLWRKLVGTRWDIVVDLRNSAVSRALTAKKRYIYGKHIDAKKHKVEQNAAVLGLKTTPAPKLWPTKGQMEKAEKIAPAGGPILAIGPTANWRGKTWPIDRYIELIRVLTAPDGILPGARVAVFAAPGEEAQAKPVFDSIPEDRRIDVIAKGTPGDVAAVLKRCALFVGNDSGLMHSAAAVGIPTVGLFGPSWPYLYRPWGAHAAYVRTPETFDELIDIPGYDPRKVKSLMTTLSLDAVVRSVGQFWYLHHPKKSA